MLELYQALEKMRILTNLVFAHDKIKFTLNGKNYYIIEDDD